MGLDVYASLAVGVKAEVRESVNSETRYNERTGKPYKVAIKETQYFLSGTDIAVKVVDDEDDDEAKEATSIPWYSRDGDTDSLSYIEGDIVGLIVARITNYSAIEVSEIPYPAITSAIASAYQQLTERFGYTGSVKVFLIKEMSS